MLKLIIGNKAYSSWSQRGWLACKQSGLPFDERVVPMWTPEWEALWTETAYSVARRQVPMIVDNETPVWDSLAIIMHLAELAGAERFWPNDPAARALARSMCAEMHSGYQALRNACPTNYRRTYPASPLAEDVAVDVARITQLWEHVRGAYGAGGDFLFGSFGAADIMFAPVTSRFLTYALPTTPVAKAYIDAVRAHPFVEDWYHAAAAEPWVVEKYER